MNDWTPNELVFVDSGSVGRRVLKSLEDDGSRVALLLNRRDLALIMAALKHHRGKRSQGMLLDLQQLHDAVYGKGGPA